jgi:hypothetical protein
MYKKIFKSVSILSLILWLILAIWFTSDNARVSSIGHNILKSLNGDFSISNVSELASIIKRGFLYKINPEEIPELFLDIGFRELATLEKQRKDPNLKQYVNAVMSVKEIGGVKRSFKVKIRSKGDRKIHRLNISEMSLKVDIKGKKRLFGIEEFSLQKPIVRNYTWEALLHLIARDQNILSLRQIPVRFFRNGVDLGIFFIEEGFGKELIESQNRKNGPIIGIDESNGIYFPSVDYDFYDEKKLKKSMPGVYTASKERLNQIKRKYKATDFDASNYFDLDAWAKFFALSDLFGAYHGTVPKSAKLYYNPSNALFEPIIFDSHVGAGKFKYFILADFLNGDPGNCDWICPYKEWYGLFLRNPDFIEKYYSWLNVYSSSIFLSSINDIINTKIEPINNAIYSEFSMSDKVFYKGMLPFYFNPLTIKVRAKLIRSKLKQIELPVSNVNSEVFFDQTGCDLNGDSVKIAVNNLEGVKLTVCDKSKSSISNTSYYKHDYTYSNGKAIDLLKCETELGCKKKSNKSIFIKSGIWISKDTNLESIDIELAENSVLILTGNTKFYGGEKDLKVFGQGMVVQLGGTILLNSVSFDGLREVKVRGVNWSGGVNIIDSYAILDKVVIKNSRSEDAINLVNSNTIIDSIRIYNSYSDGVDIDFGSIIFKDLYCENIGNDCLDTSGANVQGGNIYGKGVLDKLGSFGEATRANIDNMHGNNIGIVVVSKDATVLNINKINVTDYGLLASAFNKKDFFGPANINIKECVECSNTLVGMGNSIIINNIELSGKLSSKKIESLMYGAVYGKATVK